MKNIEKLSSSHGFPSLFGGGFLLQNHLHRAAALPQARHFAQREGLHRHAPSGQLRGPGPRPLTPGATQGDAVGSGLLKGKRWGIFMRKPEKLFENLFFL